MATRRGSNANDVIEEIHDYNIYLERREIWYHGWTMHADEDPGVDFKNTNQFIKNLRYLDATTEKPILVHFNSIGGDWYYGMAAFNAIQNCNSVVIALLYGPCMSMGSIIPLAADKVVVMPDTALMVHGGYVDHYGFTYKQGQAWAEIDKRHMKRMLDIYAKTCRKGSAYAEKSESQIRADIKRKLDSKEDWILLGQEIVDHGFAHGVFGDEGFETMAQIKDLEIDFEEDFE